MILLNNPPKNNKMKKKTITTILLTFVALIEQAQIKWHVVGTVADGVERQRF
jgi:hypothetical protein